MKSNEYEIQEIDDKLVGLWLEHQDTNNARLAEKILDSIRELKERKRSLLKASKSLWTI